ncbi:MAG: TIGR02281 family clan AA aspartic protease [Deltaproteobacteria bacterium]|nr:TIGR02281 family clan AA aspartic protease [Deltaproteobacteria bacterium]MBW2417678.1 TIGR02281 family clan AA aspartic protease [Deltaproteobacteria bacterium]
MERPSSFPIASLILGLLLHAAAPANAEIYRWTDSAGRVHFTHDLDRVPSAQRLAAKSAAEAPKGRDPIQIYDAPARVAPRSSGTSGSTLLGRAGKAHRIRVQRAGSSMRVVARINGRVDVPFILDTGASDVLLPKWAADELGLATEGPGVRRVTYQTANGVIEAPVVMLDSIELGSARAEGVVGSVSAGMQIGLLGLAFLNRFEVQIDPREGIVTLVENGMEAEGIIRGGRSAQQWRNQFYGARARIRHAEELIQEVPSSKSRALARAEAQRDALIRQLDLLEGEADDARVPFGWRD